MNSPETPTSLNVSNRVFILRVILALVIVSGVAWLFLREGREEKAAPRSPVAFPEPEPPVFLTQRPLPPGPDETEKEPPAGQVYYVSPRGADAASGLSEDSPWRTIQKALDLAEPGDAIVLGRGLYQEDLVSRRSGTKEKPILLRGESGAVITGSKRSRIIEINHDYLTLEGFTVDGLSGDPDDEDNYRDKLIYLQGKTERDGVTGVRLNRLTVQNAGGECVRLRYFARENEIAHSTIRNCGMYDFRFGGDGKNGEGVYVGTAPEQLDDGKNPTEDLDASNHNWIHHNTFDTQGNECVDIKEGAAENIVEYNRCTGQRDKDSGGMDSRGNRNVFRGNEIFGNRGAGVRLGGDNKEYGIENFVYENDIRDNEEGGIKIMRKPQAKICGNTFSKNKGDDLAGEYGEDFDNPDCS